MNLPHISTGDIFRHNLKHETPLGNIAKQFMDKGLLVPDEVTVSIVQDRLINADCKNGFILDGFPRTLTQAERLDNVLNEMKMKLDCVINLEVADNEIIKRLTGRRVCPMCGRTYNIDYEPPKENDICDNCHVSLAQRADDKKEAIINRLLAYHDQTEPLIDFYKRKNILLIIEATKHISKISSEITGLIQNVSLENKARIDILGF